jgi:hypothetical protein
MERKGTVKMVGKYDLRILLENCWKTVGKLLENMSDQLDNHCNIFEGF